jgi:hypothetical protein
MNDTQTNAPQTNTPATPERKPYETPVLEQHEWHKTVGVGLPVSN